MIIGNRQSVIKNMSILPFAHLTDDELLNEAYCRGGLTELELELAQRLERALEQLQDRTDGDDA